MPLLMRCPELVYDYLDMGMPCHDVLLIPLIDNGRQLEGTIWIVAHNPTRKFDAEDARVMQRISVFAVNALHLSDIAEQAKADAVEGQLLFRELDHRVKNTLAMTAALLRRQLRSIEEPLAKSAIEAATRRVLAMGQAHQFAGRTPYGDLAEIVRGVCAELVGSDPGFELTVDAESVIVPAHKAALLTLIVNELVTNAVKHAFGEGAVGAISVDLRRTDGDSISLSVGDDGTPLPSNGQRRSDGIGLDLVARLAEQLGGELRVEALPKRFIVLFPAHSAAH